MLPNRVPSDAIAHVNQTARLEFSYSISSDFSDSTDFVSSEVVDCPKPAIPSNDPASLPTVVL